MSKVDISTCNLNYKSNPNTNQDKWIVDLTNAKTNGYFVEAGAHNGIQQSNTYVLEKQLNWQGICVEPIDSIFNVLIKNRKICENVCLFRANHKKIEFREFVEENEVIDSESPWSWKKFKNKNKWSGYSGISAYVKRDIDWTGRTLPAGRIIKKLCVTLESLLDKHNAPAIIDYVSLDTEGSEYQILKNFPFNKYTVMAFSIENGYRTCSNLLKDNGYIQVKNKFTNVNYESFYIHPNHQSIKK